MKIARTKNRELVGLSLVVIITIVFTLFSLSIDFIDRLYNYFHDYSKLPIGEFFIRAVFLWLVMTLWLTYHRWKKAVGRQEELEDIISSINADVLVVIDRDRKITMCNASVKRVFGYEVEKVISQQTDLLYFDRRYELSNRNEIHDKLEMDGFHIGLATGKKKNGDTLPLEIITGNLRSRRGAVLLLRDITERKRAEKKLQKAHEELGKKVDERTAELVKANMQLKLQIEERKQAEEGLRGALEELKKTQSYLVQSEKMFAIGQLAAGVAHEINNPINSIINYTQMLIDKSAKQGEKAEIPEMIVEEGERIAYIVKNLLSFARQGEEKYEPALIENIIKDSLGLLEKQVLKDGIRLTVDLPANLPRIKARSQQIQQVFMNIIGNARHALKEKYPAPHEDKVLEIKSEMIGDGGRRMIRTTFYDQGAGIPTDILDRICDPFFSTKPEGEGTGLGLSISYGIVKDHGGRLSFESIEDEYTKVFVDLPVDNGWELKEEK